MTTSPCSKDHVYSAIEMFAGIGGIRLGFQRAFGERIKFLWANDFNKAACRTYQANYGTDSISSEDINTTIISMVKIPEHEILTAGFPCQPFSIAGAKKGFSDETRGNLFYRITDVLKAKKPVAFLLENVGHFEYHDGGNTWSAVKNELDELDYKVTARQLNAKYYGVPQNRPRFFIVGFKDKRASFSFPDKREEPPKLSSILECCVDEKYYLSQKYLDGLKNHRRRHEAKGHGFGYRILNHEKEIAQALVVGGMGRERNLVQGLPMPGQWQFGDKDLTKKNGEGVRKLTPRECARLQGFPDSFKIPVADTQAYRQFANSVAVPVIEAIASQMLLALDAD